MLISRFVYLSKGWQCMWTVHFTASFFFLEESLHTKRRNRRFNGEEGSVIDTSLSEERNDSSSSMQSNDSGIELVTSERRKSDTELLDLSNGDIDDIDEYTTSPDGLLMAESDVDTDSDFERVDSGTELLIAERQEEAKNLRRSQGRLQNCLIKFREVCIPECIFTQCTPTHCYHSARHSVVDSYENTVACLECLKVSCSCWGQRWTPGEAGSGGRVKLRKAGRSFIDVLRLMLDRRVFLSTLLYGLLSFVSIISNEVNDVLFSLSLSLSLALSLSLSSPPLPPPPPPPPHTHTHLPASLTFLHLLSPFPYEIVPTDFFPCLPHCT